MTKKIFLSLMAVLGLLLSAHAQEREITGSVKDHAGAGIVGATILVEGTTKGTTSGADGSFSIKAAPDNVLVVSFMGYQSHTIKEFKLFSGYTPAEYLSVCAPYSDYFSEF